jgi:hypothetical protein
MLVQWQCSLSVPRVWSRDTRRTVLSLWDNPPTLQTTALELFGPPTISKYTMHRSRRLAVRAIRGSSTKLHAVYHWKHYHQGKLFSASGNNSYDKFRRRNHCGRLRGPERNCRRQRDERQCYHRHANRSCDIQFAVQLVCGEPGTKSGRCGSKSGPVRGTDSSATAVLALSCCRLRDSGVKRMQQLWIDAFRRGNSGDLELHRCDCGWSGIGSCRFDCISNDWTCLRIPRSSATKQKCESKTESPTKCSQSPGD